MTFLLGILVFLYGITIGSFLNVCIYRIPLKESIVFGRSHCIKCKENIKFYDLIPVFSYIALKGRCRFCKKKINIRYPIIELINGVLFIIAFLKFGLSFNMVYYSLLSSILLVIAVIDFEHEIIPDRLLITAFAFGIIYNIFFGDYISVIIGFLAVSLVLYLIAILSKGGIGGGDIKMMAAFGFCLGWQKIVLALFLGSFVGSVAAIYMMAFKNYSGKTKIPFGPFLAIGIYISILYGSQLIGWYTNLFHI